MEVKREVKPSISTGGGLERPERVLDPARVTGGDSERTDERGEDEILF